MPATACLIPYSDSAREDNFFHDGMTVLFSVVAVLVSATVGVALTPSNHTQREVRTHRSHLATRSRHLRTSKSKWGSCGAPSSATGTCIKMDFFWRILETLSDDGGSNEEYKIIEGDDGLSWITVRHGCDTGCEKWALQFEDPTDDEIRNNVGDACSPEENSSRTSNDDYGGFYSCWLTTPYSTGANHGPSKFLYFDKMYMNDLKLDMALAMCEHDFACDGHPYLQWDLSNYGLAQFSKYDLDSHNNAYTWFTRSDGEGRKVS
uniref:Uncharacterized protein n=1 Tax=Chromera velia CCMP2878 TaxID=1169474 RepID=A0A0K6SAM3_9ALVE|eukprot:Cvel_11533.t2-p1 / transcript=Cvel_11533.t2 / gene=Cvel_11533 / organism=Chromera_velia_CCMP2878 / gene_product=hypothetical protein / transcript_product=hypothetical protein / location=Cvel_scaffold727:62282-63067(+) / protein_length=262 / sequence_SO=supercontig / SO=protein_coding / is_pseudo=false